mgnify:CR=1 FL=1
MKEKDSGSDIQLVIFKVGNEEFGVEISQVREIIKLDGLTRIPDSPAHVEGVINLRGQITPVINFRDMIGMGHIDHASDTRVMITDCSRDTFGIIVDSVTEVKTVQDSMIEPLPEMLKSMRVSPYIQGVIKLSNRILLLADLIKINISEEESEINEDAPAAAVPEEPCITNTSPAELNEFYIDALRELGNIGSSHAATSLSQLICKTVNMTVPKIDVISIESIPHIMSDAKKVAGMLFEVRDGEEASGYMYLLFQEECALTIADTLLCVDPGTTKDLDDLARSAVMEVGNILASSFCDAIAEFLGMVMLPSPPSFNLDMVDSLIDPTVVQISMVADDVILFRTDLSDENNTISGYLLLFPNPGTLDTIMKKLDEKIGQVQ